MFWYVGVVFSVSCRVLLLMEGTPWRVVCIWDSSARQDHLQVVLHFNNKFHANCQGACTFVLSLSVMIGLKQSPVAPFGSYACIMSSNLFIKSVIVEGKTGRLYSHIRKTQTDTGSHPVTSNVAPLHSTMKHPLNFTHGSRYFTYFFFYFNQLFFPHHVTGLYGQTESLSPLWVLIKGYVWIWKFISETYLCATYMLEELLIIISLIDGHGNIFFVGTTLKEMGDRLEKQHLTFSF